MQYIILNMIGMYSFVLTGLLSLLISSIHYNMVLCFIKDKYLAPPPNKIRTLSFYELKIKLKAWKITQPSQQVALNKHIYLICYVSKCFLESVNVPKTGSFLNVLIRMAMFAVKVIIEAKPWKSTQNFLETLRVFIQVIRILSNESLELPLGYVLS